jgi:oxalate---CoA ligase
MATACVRWRSGHAGTDNIGRSCKLFEIKESRLTTLIESQVDFKLDITRPKAARSEIDWNSKRAGQSRICFLLRTSNVVHIDDDHIETTIFTRSCFSGISTLDTEDAEVNQTCTPSAVEDGDEGHGKTTEGTVACCRKASDGQVNCDSCLNTALKAWVLQSDPKEQEVAHRILDVLDVAGPAGLDISTVIVSTLYRFGDDGLNGQFNQTNTMVAGGSAETALSTLASLMNNSVPLAVLVGHSRPLVVCARQSVAWTVTVSEEPRINVLPRRWLDSRGVKVRETWRAAMRAVIGILVFRPGIPQVRQWHAIPVAGRVLMARNNRPSWCGGCDLYMTEPK